jgi:hypothetical protein
VSDEFDGLPSVILAPNRTNVCQEQGMNILRGFSIESLPNYEVKVLGKPVSILVGKGN